LTRDLRNIDAEIDIRRILSCSCKSKKRWRKIWIYTLKQGEKMGKMVKKKDSEVEINLYRRVGISKGSNRICKTKTLMYNKWAPYYTNCNLSGMRESNSGTPKCKCWRI
jgi:hypothetical protein